MMQVMFCGPYHKFSSMFPKLPGKMLATGRSLSHTSHIEKCLDDPILNFQRWPGFHLEKAGIGPWIFAAPPTPSPHTPSPPLPLPPLPLFSLPLPPLPLPLLCTQGSSCLLPPYFAMLWFVPTWTVETTVDQEIGDSEIENCSCLCIQLKHCCRITQMQQVSRPTSRISCWRELASFQGRRRNGPTSSKCNCVMHLNIAVPIPFQ